MQVHDVYTSCMCLKTNLFFFRSTARRSRGALRRAKHVTSRIKPRDSQRSRASSDAGYWSEPPATTVYLTHTTHTVWREYKPSRLSCICNLSFNLNLWFFSFLCYVPKCSHIATYVCQRKRTYFWLTYEDYPIVWLYAEERVLFYFYVF